MGQGGQVKFDVDESGYHDLANLAQNGQGRELWVVVFEKADV